MQTTRLLLVSLTVLASFSLSSHALAQNPNYPGYLGVFVDESNGGMRITGFIRDTPAARLAADGGLSRNDVILKLGNRWTRTLGELKAARDRIPDDQEAKMILRSSDGLYYVWISRNEAAATGLGAPGGDTFSRGAPGVGDENQDFRPKGSGDNQDSGEFRPKP
jgi:hypothetical protein